MEGSLAQPTTALSKPQVALATSSGGRSGTRVPLWTSSSGKQDAKGFRRRTSPSSHGRRLRRREVSLSGKFASAARDLLKTTAWMEFEDNCMSPLVIMILGYPKYVIYVMHNRLSDFVACSHLVQDAFKVDSFISGVMETHNSRFQGFPPRWPTWRSSWGHLGSGSVLTRSLGRRLSDRRVFWPCADVGTT